jgi:uncharacterized protein (DUF2235 family)
MAKTIIFCADGTWNRPGANDPADSSATPTNVFKLFANLLGKDDPADTALADEQERAATDPTGTVQQIAKYLHGVGDSDNFLIKVLGGTLGAGIVSRIVRGYTFVSRNYLPGDKIFLLGFSRGAYTARALGGLIAARGLLDATQIDPTDKTQAYRLGAAVWYDWRKSAVSVNPNLLGRLQEIVLDLPAFLSASPTTKLVANVPIEAIAVWDTVGSLGIPDFADTDSTVDAFRFADTALNPLVNHGIHGVATDEERANFTPTLWDPDPRVVQCLWPGSHCDVGGGYPLANGESFVSDASLVWMMGVLQSLGVLFAPIPSFVPKPDSTATAHQSWLRPPYNLLPHGQRVFPYGLRRSTGLVARLAAGPVISDPGQPAAVYAPDNIGGTVS